VLFRSEHEVLLSTRDVRIGGNLLIAGDTLLISTHKELFALRPHVAQPRAAARTASIGNRGL
jgi:hypothetical protein